MSKQLSKTHSQEPNKLQRSSEINTALILREQPDKAKSVFLISSLLEKIVTLWQIPNWSPSNSVLLAEWIFETYQYEPMEVIIKVLNSPPPAANRSDNTWRLTPDVVAQWMGEELLRQAIKRERENEELKRSAALLPDADGAEKWKEFYKTHFFQFNEARKDLPEQKKGGLREWMKDPEHANKTAQVAAKANEKWRAEIEKSLPLTQNDKKEQL